MKIDRLQIKDFLMFTEDKNTDAVSFHEEFVPGINIFIGGNATGKSTLLKCIYGACELSNKTINPNRVRPFIEYFSAPGHKVKDKIQAKSDGDFSLIRVIAGEDEFRYKAWVSGGEFLAAQTAGNQESWEKLSIQSILIPTAEMLSHSKGLVAMSEKYGLPFDGTQMDILINAQLWETKLISERNKKILATISQVIGGEVVYENDVFYVVKSNGIKVEFSFEAEGFKKLGLLWKLIRNGLLESGSILLWDEPEASLNPELIATLVDIFYILMNDGVQVFLATHNYTLAKYIDIKKKTAGDTLFLALNKTDSGGIKVSRSNDYSNLMDNPIEASEEKLYEAIIQRTLED